MSSINLTVINLHLSKSIVDLSGRELVSEGHQGVPESLGVDLAVLLEGLKRSEDDIVIIGSTGHLGGEQGDHLGEVHGAIHFVKHGLCLATTNVLAMGSEGGAQVVGIQQTVLVGIHDAESLLELLDGGVGERVEDVGFLRHGDSESVAGLLDT